MLLVLFSEKTDVAPPQTLKFVIFHTAETFKYFLLIIIKHLSCRNVIHVSMQFWFLPAQQFMRYLANKKSSRRHQR